MAPPSAGDRSARVRHLVVRGIRLVITPLVLDAVIVVTRALSVQLCASLARAGGLAVQSVSAAPTAYASLGIATRTADPIRRMSHDI